jgi:hypothetical protein
LPLRSNPLLSLNPYSRDTGAALLFRPRRRLGTRLHPRRDDRQRPTLVGCHQEDKDFSDYLMDRTVLFDRLPVSHTAYLLLRKIFSTKPERRPSLSAIRAEVLTMDTFFLSDEEAVGCGWVERMDKQMQRKIRAAVMSFFEDTFRIRLLRDLQLGIVVGIVLLYWLVHFRLRL